MANEAIATGQMEQLSVLVKSHSQYFGNKVLVVDATGSVLAVTYPLSSSQRDKLANEPDLRAVLREQAAAKRVDAVVDGVEVVHVSVPLDRSPSVRGALRITVNADKLGADVKQVWMSLTVIDLVLLIVVLLVVFSLVRWVRRPVRELEKSAKLLAAGQGFEPASVLTGPPEIRQLAVTFNGMATRLQQLISSQRAFAAEASHQLKTPLAALRLRLETLEPYIALRARNNLESALAETDRLARMIDGLLAMAALEESSMIREPVDLDALVHDRARVWAPVVERSGVHLLVMGARIGEVWAVPGAIEQIIDNLLANALRVSPPGSTITLDRRPNHAGRYRRREGAAELHVIDQGPGMSEEHRKRAFDRFWRAPGSGKDGTGLGLAIVQQLARASGGEVVLMPAPGSGLDAVVALMPVESAPQGRPRQLGTFHRLLNRVLGSRGRHSVTSQSR
ncbi:two-component sensor histidine kinase [Sinosporangium siamense]|uniref:histidine kinase n=2 Tax=Sinosporangium siamense TaxID=1367973 RepID=A0A919RKG5_9ACTN|nr:two-component sensor histidine kinase [Sinosporangium siamense]